MIRVLHCVKLLIPGGVERTRMSLFEHLGAPGYAHGVLCTEIQDPDYAQHMRERVDFIEETGPVSSVLAPGRYRRAARLARAWSPHVVHGAIIEGYTLAAVAGRLARAPLVVMEEPSDPTNRSWRGHTVARLAAALAHHCVAVSPSVGRYLTDTLRVPARKVTVIENGVERPTLPGPDAARSLRERLGIGADDIVIGSVGRMHDETHKRFGDLIAAFARLETGERVKLLLVGDGPERPGLERLAGDLGVAGRVRFAGLQPDVGPYYGLMSVFSLASQREAFGMVNAEAMRARLPVVATRVGGIPDIVEDRRTGFLVPPRDPPALAAALQRLVDDPELRARMGAAGAERADRLFSAERYASDVDRLYRRLLAERGVAA